MIPSGLKTTNPLFLAFVSLYLYSSSASPINQTSHELPHPRRALEMTLGLNPFNLHRNGVAIGFLPALGESIDANLPSQINAKLGAPMAIVSQFSHEVFFFGLHHVHLLSLPLHHVSHDISRVHLISIYATTTKKNKNEQCEIDG